MDRPLADEQTTPLSDCWRSAMHPTLGWQRLPAASRTTPDAREPPGHKSLVSRSATSPANQLGKEWASSEIENQMIKDTARGMPSGRKPPANPGNAAGSKRPQAQILRTYCKVDRSPETAVALRARRTLPPPILAEKAARSRTQHQGTSPRHARVSEGTTGGPARSSRPCYCTQPPATLAAHQISRHADTFASRSREVFGLPQADPCPGTGTHILRSM